MNLSDEQINKQIVVLLPILRYYQPVSCLIFPQNRFGTGTCKCGDANNAEVSFRHDEGLWCCKSSKASCEVKNYNGAEVANCVGKAIPLTQPCFDANTRTSTCNYFPEDPFRNYWASRSHIDICNDNK